MVQRAQRVRAMTGVRYGIYARYSSDLQSDKSIEAQVREAKLRIAQLGGDPDAAIVLTDYAESGAGMDRLGAQTLLEAVAKKSIDVLVTESVERVSRRSADNMDFYDRLHFYGVGFEGLNGVRFEAGDQSSFMTYGLHSMMGQQALRDISQKTLRGLREKARSGKATGNVAYGYRTVKGEDGSAIEIDPVSSKIIKGIFTDYLKGHSFATIAEDLNYRKIPPPRSKKEQATWMGSCVRAMLCNERYAGRWIFGARAWVKRPGTNIRVPRPRKGGPLEKQERPDLAIIDRETFDAVRERFNERKQEPKNKKRMDYLLSGLLRCGTCGGNMTCVGGATRRYGCAVRKTRGSNVCSNSTTVLIPELESVFLGVTQRRLTDRMPEIREMFVEELRAFMAKVPDHKRDAQKAVADLEGRVKRILDAVERGNSTASMEARLGELETKLEAAKRELAATSTKVEAPVMPTANIIAKRIRELGKLSDGPADVGRELLRGMLAGPITCAPKADGSYEASWEIVPGTLLLEGKTPSRVSSGGRVSSSSCGGVIWRLDTIPCKGVTSRRVAQP